jgi:hypothetical protein
MSRTALIRPEAGGTKQLDDGIGNTFVSRAGENDSLVWIDLQDWADAVKFSIFSG